MSGRERECPNCEVMFSGRACPRCQWQGATRRGKPAFPPEEAKPVPPPVPPNTEAEWAAGLEAARALVKALSGRMSFDQAGAKVAEAFEGVPARNRDRRPA